MPVPVISIVIPSHNRRDLLLRMLDALAAQQPETPAFEVIVVADGCHDGTQDMLATYGSSYPLLMIEQPGVGPSRARNAGAERASAGLILFLDDDVIPTPSLVAAHIAAHVGEGARAVIGPYPPAPHASGDRFRINARRWWEAHFTALAEPGHRFNYTDLLTGNLSLRKSVWEAVGGLDPQFARAREDLELGVRLIKQGVAFHYAPDALGWHQEYLTTSPKSALHRAKEEGRSDVRMAIKHPDMANALRAVRQIRRAGRGKKLKFALIRRAAILDKPIIAFGPGTLRFIEKLGLVSVRRRLENILREFCTFRGAAEALGKDWAAFAAQPMPAIGEPDLDIDLANGLDAAERLLAQHQPACARILYQGDLVCTLPWSPVAERWTGRHLRPFLAKRAPWQMIPILAAQRYGGTPADWSRLDAIGMIGSRDFNAQLGEAQRQWRRVRGG